MIGSYRDKDTERLAAGDKIRQWEPFRKQAEKRLRILMPIQISDQWRICFKWPKAEPGPSNVEIVDYH